MGYVIFAMSMRCLSGEAEPELKDGIKAVNLGETVNKKEIRGLNSSILQG